ncbi:MAG TPA: hypothetical protein VGF64_13945 [Acidimicrobiales bacterium]
MNAWELAAVAGGVAGASVVALVVMVLLARLVAAVANLDRATRELGRAVGELRAEALPLGHGGMDGSAASAGSGVHSNGDGERVEHGAPPSVSRRGNGRARLPDLTLVTPVIKARALGRGTSLAAREFRQRRER